MTGCLFKSFALLTVISVIGIGGLGIYAWYPEKSLIETISRAGLNEKDIAEGKIDFSVRIYKKTKRLELWQADTLLKTYRVSTGPGSPQASKPRGPGTPLDKILRSVTYYPGDKQVEGDLRTPEGSYHLAEDFRPSSINYRFALISYPDQTDREHSPNPGGAVGIHGIGGSGNYLGRLHTLVRHTQGCIALNNHQIDELARVIGKDTKIEILP